MNRIFIAVASVVVALGLAVGAYFWGVQNGKQQAQDAQAAFLASRGFDPANGGFGGNGGGAGALGQGGQGQAGRAGGFGGIAGRAGQRGAVGTIDSIQGNSFTVKSANGDNLTVSFDQTTPIMKDQNVNTSELKVGTNVLVTGDRSGNNVSARSIQITDGLNGLFGGLGGGGRRGPNANSTPSPGR